MLFERTGKTVQIFFLKNEEAKTDWIRICLAKSGVSKLIMRCRRKVVCGRLNLRPLGMENDIYENSLAISIE